MKHLLLFSLAAMLLVSAKTTAQTSTPVYGASPFQDSLWTIDTSTYAIINSVQLVDTLTGMGTIDGVNGMAVQPCTGDYYIIYKASGTTGRLLGTLNPADGILTQIGNTGDNIAAISFLDETTLYAQSGDGGNTSELLYTLDISTAALSPEATSGNGDDGEVICFNPDNGLFYHWSGLGTQNSDEILESYDPVTSIYAPVTMSGFDGSEMFGATYIGNDVFLMNDINSVFITCNVTTGVLDTVGLGIATDDLRGLAFPARYVWYDQANTDSICPFGDSTLMLATADATAYQWYLDGVAVTGATDDSLYASVPGSYKCEITRGTCVAFSDDSLNIGGYVVDPAMLSTITASFCAGDSVTILDAGTGGVSNEWLVGGMVVDTDISYTATAGGNVIYRVYSANGCYDEATVVVTENALPVVMATADQPSYCDGDMITLTASGDPATYTWNNSVLDGVAFMQPISTVTYTVVAVDANLCSDSVQIDVTVNENPSSTSTTVDEILGTDGSIDLTVVGTGPFTFDWDNDGVGDIDDPEDLTGLPAGTYTVIVYGPTGCTTTETVIVGSQVGLNEFGLNASMSIFPNPNTGKFTVTFTEMSTENLSVQIINALGQVISEGEVVNNSLEVDIRDAGAGIYMIQVTDGTNFATENIIVE